MKQKYYFIIGLITVIILVGIIIGINIKQQKQQDGLLNLDMSKLDLSKVLVTNETFKQDEYTFQNIGIERDILKLDISSGGGCKNHFYGLIWNGYFLESSPVQVNLFLAHDSQGDTCEAILYKNLEFDLTPLREAYQNSYGATGKIIIKFKDFDDNVHRISYEL